MAISRRIGGSDAAPDGPEDGADAPRESSAVGRIAPALATVVVLVVASPIVVGALSYVGDTWFPVGDWASMVFRTNQVGTLGTPLIGTYSVKGWAHPGPFLFYVAAPLYRLTGGDTRALLWTGAIVNVVCLAAAGRVAWRRGRLALVLVVGVALILLIHGLGVGRAVDLWNPNLGVMPFALFVLLMWDAALGRPRSLLWATLAGTIAIQCHVSNAPLVVIVVAWFLGWHRWSSRLTAGARRSSSPDDPTDAPDADPIRPSLLSLLRSPRAKAVAAASVLLWLPVLVDLVIGVHNPARLAKYFVVNSSNTVGVNDAVGLVSLFVSPTGPWMAGREPLEGLSVQGTGPVALILVLVALAGCVLVGRRRHLVDVTALASLTLLLVVTALPLTARIVLPVFDYLTQGLKIVGALVWLTFAWTAWRAWNPAAVGVRRVAAAVAAAGLVAAAVWSYGGATRIQPPGQYAAGLVQEVRARAADDLPRDQRYLIVSRGDPLNDVAPGLFAYLDEDGFRVVTEDGYNGLKWGYERRWTRGDEPVDATLTIATHFPGSYVDAYAECAQNPEAELVAGIDKLSADERATVYGLQLKRIAADTLTAAERREGDRLEARNLRIGVFRGDRACAKRDPNDNERTSEAGSGNVVPVIGVGAIAIAAVGGTLLYRRRRRPTSAG